MESPLSESYNIIKETLSIAASLAVIAAAVLSYSMIKNAVAEYMYNMEIVRISESMNAINSIRSQEFLKAFSTFKQHIENPDDIQKSDYQAISDSYNALTFGFDSFARLYEEAVVDQCLLKQASYNMALDYSNLLTKFQASQTNENTKARIYENHQYFDKYLESMSQNSCPFSNP